jgi:SAM-dependent methyltransferase
MSAPSSSSSVRAHYDAQAAKRQRRSERPDYNVCLHNNAHKAQLITRLLEGVAATHPGGSSGISGSIGSSGSSSKARVLDIACGKGGDILKYGPELCAEYVGVDLSPVCIDEARVRARADPRFTFLTCDVGLAALKLKATGERPAFLSGGSFDAVSCMFAFHYFFADQAMLDAVVELVGCSLRPGGLFFGIMTDERAVRLGAVESHLLSHGASHGASSFGNKLFSVHVDDSVRRAVLDKRHAGLGASIRFCMTGGGFDCAEYCAPLDCLSRACQKAGLRLVSFENQGRVRLEDRFKRATGATALSAEEAQLVAMYAQFVFKKD